MASYSETLSSIYNLRGGIIDLRLDRMDRALALFDHPEEKFISFHIAGTNGKGSTAAMLHSILLLQGYRPALYTSPHLVSFTERIRVGAEEISRDEVVELAEEINVRTRVADIQLTFFEFITVMAFIHFFRQQVEVAVIEVGLGGRLDATNLVRPIVSLITTISKDHEAYLGSDIVSIAQEKGGIIKENVPAVCGALPAAANGAIRQIAAQRHAPVYFLEQDFSFSLKSQGYFDYKGPEWQLKELFVGLRGRHQRANASVALAALEFARTAFPVAESAVREGLRTVFWPGRFETIGNRPTVVLDGAHNGEGVKALVEELEQFRDGRKIKLLFASMEDKDWRLMLGTLSALADEVVVTRVSMARSADPNLLGNHLSGKVPSRVIESSSAAVRYVLDQAKDDDIILVTGSLYLLGEVRPILYRQSGLRDRS
jgi:dihydrofolate synthase/folylpolyglutamate synthase